MLKAGPAKDSSSTWPTMPTRDITSAVGRTPSRRGPQVWTCQSTTRVGAADEPGRFHGRPGNVPDAAHLETQGVLGNNRGHCNDATVGQGGPETLVASAEAGPDEPRCEQEDQEKDEHADGECDVASPPPGWNHRSEGVVRPFDRVAHWPNVRMVRDRLSPDLRREAPSCGVGVAG